MGLLKLALLLSLAVVTPPPRGSPPSVSTGSQVRTDLTFRRPGGVLGRAAVYLPAEYTTEPTRHFPLLVLLHGLGGDRTDWIVQGHLQQMLDEASANGIIEPLIAIIPDGHAGYWVDWPDNNPRHRFGALVDETRRLAERRYRTDGRRAIAGLSMGGFGALSQALRTPGRYRAAISLSGALFRRAPTGRAVYLAAFGGPGLGQTRFIWHNPLDLVRLGLGRRLAVWLDCGADDAEKFTRGLSAMRRALRAAGIDHVARLRPGRHQWEVWTAGFQEALPWLESHWMTDQAQ